MATKYHINPETGRVNICRAKVQCDFAVDGVEPPHFDNKADAKAGAEEMLSEEHGGSFGETVSKKKEALPQNSRKNTEGDVSGLELKTTDSKILSADPVDFDAEYIKTYERQIDAQFDLQNKLAEAQRVISPKHYDRYSARSVYELSVKESWDKLKANPNLLDDVYGKKNLYSEILQANRDVKKAEKDINTFDEAYEKRGSWNRAFLVPNGHVHSSINCSTCNKGKEATKFQAMTNYSNHSEDEIVENAGYRACTTCYPTAPVGNERNLPTKMFTKSEEEKEQARIEREAARIKKANDAVSKAPTATGEPLVLGIERFKTESTAVSYYSDKVVDDLVDEAEDAEHKIPNREYMQEKREHQLTILKSLAEKRDVSIKEVQEELKPKVMSKIKKHNRDRKKVNPIAHINGFPHRDLPEIEYKADTYGLSEEKYNTSPRDWKE